MSAERLLVKVSGCPNYRTLYAMEADFNSAGLTIQTTTGNRIILCRLVKGRPVAKEAMTDFIFIGSLDGADRDLDDRVSQKICDFISNTEGPAGTVKDIARSWRNGLRMYESSIAIVNEDINYIGETLCD